jgi:hypothetical protein
VDETLPAWAYGRAVLAARKRWAMLDVAAAQNDQEVTKIVAARDMRRRALELARRDPLDKGFLDKGILDKAEIKEWKDFATELCAIFHAVLPDQSADAAYRFVAEVAPSITGESVTYVAVAWFLKHRNVVKGHREIE